ncbi:MAG: site-specific integrase [Thermodesulfovibrio sp.]|nr:site-specific integrase [Thermodesulfovibrio sp.]
MALVKRGTIWWIEIYHNGKRRRFSTKTSNRKKAEEIYTKVLLRLNSSGMQAEAKSEQATMQPESSISYEEFYGKYYLPWCYKRQEFYNSKKYFLNVLPDWFKKLRLNQITTKDVEMVQSHFIGKEKTTATCNRYIAILQASMTKAYDWNMISQKRLEEVRKVKLLKGENKRLRYLTVDEIKRLLSSCDKHIYPIVFIALNTGMRRGEIPNLKWSNVDLKENMLKNQKQ